MDYIAYQKLENISPHGITYNGINVGIRKCEEVYVPLTILVSPNSNVEEYITDEQLKIVKSVYVTNRYGKVIEEKHYNATLKISPVPVL